MDLRELKGLEIAARMKVLFEGGAWLVPSQSGNGKYRVVLGSRGDTCTCDDFQLHQKPCKHVHAARLVRAWDYGGKSPALDTDAVPKRKTYQQDWPAYNEAQATEKHRFQELLCDLCRGLGPPPAGAPAGRKPVPMADRVFAAAFKVYSTVSSRRFSCDLSDAHGRGYLTRPLHYNSINAYLENPELTPVLRALIVQSSLPLRAVEVDFAADSSGFSTSRFVRWYDEKYGVERSGHDWVKVHLMCGVKTNVVTAAEILDKNAADSPQLVPLARKTAENFTIREVSADKAFSGVDNIEAVAALGGVAFIPFKSNATGGAGGLFEKMFHFYALHRDEFLQHYHKRSNVESTFAMIKAKFRDHVRSKTDTAMANEVLCKVLGHNLCCVIQSQCELGIEALFWGAPPRDGAPAILPLRRPG
jgi:transposase